MKEYVSKREKATVEAIWKAFFGLLCDRPADSISVKVVCDRAGCHRTTFYNYFKDIFGLYIYGAELLSKRLVRIIELARRRDRSYLTELDRLIAEYKKPLTNIVNARYVKKLHYIIAMVIEKRVLQYVIKSGGKCALNVPIEIMVRYYLGGCCQLAFVWLENPGKISDQEFVRQLQPLLEYFIAGLFFPAKNEYAAAFCPEERPNA